MDLKTLSEKKADEIVAAAPELSDADKRQLGELEMARETPRKTVLSAIGYDVPVDPAEVADPDDGIQRLDTAKEFGMVHHRGLKHYFQGNKIFDRGSRELLVDLNEKKDD